MSDYNPPPKRDKFSAMAAQQQQKKPPETQPEEPQPPGQPELGATNVQSIAVSSKRDKFASMAAMSQSQQQHEESQPSAMETDPQESPSSTHPTTHPSGSDNMTTSLAAPPKRDKFASLAAKLSTTGAQPQMVVPDSRASLESETQTSVNKRDKFASMAASRIESAEAIPIGLNQSDSTTIATQPPPKRDKFASLAARSSNTADEPSTLSVLGAAVTSPPPKRDKFASLAAREGGGMPKRDKFSAMAATAAKSGPSVSTESNDNDDAAAAKALELERQARQSELLKRCHQRDSVWQDLDLAEAKTIQLLQLAETTAIALAEKTMTNDDASSVDMSDLQRIHSQYQQTVVEIHSLLKPHADLVQAYKAPTRVNRMYLQRVELRLADAKRSLLQDFINLQKQEADDETGEISSDVVQDLTTTSQMENPQETNDSNEITFADTGKRKRQD